ncbi:GGDEF domain-containing protein [Gorillibacterium sp. sgz5001074]|uniref:GGDEF domain-containing protein n=1 Tax=Gorillibacterium sp. sgz5001074 TaxID=3446695 RepID=UPI003F662385
MLSLTKDPELAAVLESTRKDRGNIGIIHLDTVDYGGLVQEGRSFCDRINRHTGDWLNTYMKERREWVAGRRMGDDWYLFVGLEEREPFVAARKLERLAAELKKRLETSLQDANGGEPVTVYSGHALLEHRQGSMAEALYQAMKRSVRSIHQAATLQEDHSVWEEFCSILEERRISSVYQPIVSLSDASIFGYEALSRGPQGSKFHSPLELFGYAEERGGLYELDRLAREKAIEGCLGLGREQRVFINIPAHVIHDPQFASGHTLKMLERCGIEPRNVVFEITERTSIEDFATAKRILQHYRNQGYQIAIDDAGAGYSSLQAIAELQPDFIKVDRSLITNIHQDRMKETILETFVSFARKMSIRMIAEGIESWEELKKLSQMGVHYAQGFLIGRPVPQMDPLREEVAAQIERINRLQGFDSLVHVGHLAVHIRTFGPKTPISEVANFFKSHEEASGTVIVDAERPVGVVMRDKLFQQLAGQYGISLYWNRPIEQLMDRQALIVEETSPIEQVSQMAMSREKNRLYDWIVITSKDKMSGIASVQTLLEAITNLRMETARVANPLTGLPGNTQINRELNRRLFDGRPFSVIYADLDYFKWYNDRYGFQKGDQLIQFTADVLQQSASACGHPHDFVGHVGGDDFIVITEAEESTVLCEEIIRRFRQGVGLFYEEEEWSYAVDRSGNRVESDGVHISLSLVICLCAGSATLERISQTAAALKKKSKSRNGSVYTAAYLDGCCGPDGSSNKESSCSIL